MVELGFDPRSLYRAWFLSCAWTLISPVLLLLWTPAQISSPAPMQGREVWLGSMINCQY